MPDAKAEVAKFLDWKRERDAEAEAAMRALAPPPPREWAECLVWPPTCPMDQRTEIPERDKWVLAKIYNLVHAMPCFSREDVYRYVGASLQSEVLNRWLAWGRVERLPYECDAPSQVLYRWREDC